MSEAIYLIEKAWVDPMENSYKNAFGYKVIGFKKTEQDAKDFCAVGGVLSNSDCWAIHGFVDVYRYKKIPLLK